MKIIRDEERIAKLKKRSQQASAVGFIFLLGGFVVLFVVDSPNLILYQTGALIIGFTLSQYGLHLTHRYSRSPRPDEVLDNALRPVAKDGILYHYVLPAPHVLLTKSGPVVFNLKYQIGNIEAHGDKWKQTGIGFRRFFGQEGLGRPTKETESMIHGLANFIRKNAPSVEEVPIGAMIVFTSKNIKNLDVSESTIPAMHYAKVKGFMKQKGNADPLPQEDYEALLRAFDEAAGDLV